MPLDCILLVQNKFEPLKTEVSRTRPPIGNNANRINNERQNEPTRTVGHCRLWQGDSDFLRLNMMFLFKSMIWLHYKIYIGLYG